MIKSSFELKKFSITETFTQFFIIKLKFIPNPEFISCLCSNLGSALVRPFFWFQVDWKKHWTSSNILSLRMLNCQSFRVEVPWVSRAFKENRSIKKSVGVSRNHSKGLAQRFEVQSISWKPRQKINFHNHRC